MTNENVWLITGAGRGKGGGIAKFSIFRLARQRSGRLETVLET